MKLQSLKPRVATIPGRLPTMQPGSWRADKQSSSTARGYGYKWQQARLEHLKAHPLCVYCEQEIPRRITPASIVDHRIPHRGDMSLFWDRKNWQSLCKPHHDGKKQREEAQLGGG